MYVISVDPARCQGHARCVVFAPDVFDIDDEGYSFVQPERGTCAQLSEDVQLAIANCPERAISATDDDSKLE